MKRVYEHNNKLADGFTKKYNIVELLYYESHGDILEAIKREKVIKRWKREWKWNLIKSVNPEVKNLYDNWNVQPIEVY